MKKIVILDSIRSLQNVGAVFRIADGAGFDKVILCGYTPYPPRNLIAKTALGAQNSVDWEYYKDIFEVLKNLKQQDYTIYGVELTQDAIDYRELFGQKYKNICLILGNEVQGIGDEVLSFCDASVMIPMKGIKESLNVSVAAGVVMYSLCD